MLKLHEQLNIFVCWVPNRTHLSQTLNVALYGLTKQKWQRISKNWKLKNLLKSTIPKDEFLRLLKELCKTLNCENFISGFSVCGIHPFCPYELYKKLSSEESSESAANVSDTFLDHLKELRNPTKQGIGAQY